MVEASFNFLIAAIFIVASGVFLTKSADKIVEATGWGKLFVGSFLLAAATSIPELSVDMKSVQLNLPDLAVGDLLGSNLCNLLILSMLDFAFPSQFKRTAFSPVFLHHSLAAVISIILTAIVGIGLASKIRISFLGANLFTWMVVIMYFAGMRLIHKEGKISPKEVDNFKNVFPPKKLSVIKGFLGYFFSAAVIYLAAPYLVRSADQIAKLSGLEYSFLGTTLLALSTSLPELVATFSAYKMNNPDLALGNIFGSNAFNMILFLPLDFYFEKDLFNSVSTSHTVTALGTIAVTSWAVIGQLYRKKERSRFLEPSSEAIFILTFGILYLVYLIS